MKQSRTNNTHSGNHPAKSLLAFATIALIAAASSAAHALPSGFEVTEIASSRSAGAFPYYRGAALNNDGVLCYKGASTTAAAIVRSDGQTKAIVASTQDGSGSFDQFPSSLCAINAAGDVAFDSCRNCKPLPPGVPPPSTTPAPIQYSIYTRLFSAGAPFPLQQVASSGTKPTDFALAALPSLTDSGAVYFSGALQNGVRGIWRRAPLSQGGELSTILDSTSGFADLGGVFANQSEQITFGATEDDSPTDRAIYGPTQSKILGAFNGFRILSLPALNNLGDVAALAIGSSPSAGSTVPQNGLFLNGAPFIMSGGDFQMVEISPFRSVSVNDNRQMVFAATRRDGTGAVYLAANGGLLTILQEGDLLPGYTSPIFRAEVSRQALNNKLQVALVVVLKDGTELVLRLEPTAVVLPGDQCPSDNSKFEPGVCGCGVSDADSNKDGILNCQVTPRAHQLTQQILLSLPQLKRLPPKASKDLVRAQAVLQKQIVATGNQLYTLVRGSREDVRLKNQRKSPLTLVNTIRTKLRLAVNTKDRKFSANRAAAITSLRQFSNVLIIP